MIAGRRSLLMAACVAGPLGIGATPASAQDAAPEAKPEGQAETQAESQAAEEARIKAAAKVLQRSLDALRARNFERWIATYSPDIVIRSPQMHINNRKEMRAIYGSIFEMGLPDPVILESGWTGERIYVRQSESVVEGGASMVSYAEYEIQDGLITAVYAYSE